MRPRAARSVVVQDNARERQVIAHCRLIPAQSRAGVDAHDENGNPFEIKSTTQTGVSTARDVGLHTLHEWRSRYWIIALGKNLPPGFEISHLYIAHPDDLEECFSGIQQRIERDERILNLVVNAVQYAGLSESAIERCVYLIRRGMTLNNPKIPVSVVQKNATPLDLTDPHVAHEQIERFVLQHPLRSSHAQT